MTLIVPSGSKLSGLIDFVISAWTGGWLKLVLIAALIGGGFWWFRLWLNRHDDRIFQDGKNRAVETMAKDYEARLEVRLSEAKVMSDTAAKDRAMVDVRLEKLEAWFPAIFGEIRQIKVASAKREVVYVEKATAVPASGLDDAIRILSGDIARQSAHR